MQHGASRRKEIAFSLRNVLKHPIMEDIMDRSVPILNSDIETVAGYWNYDLFGRNPAPAYIGDDGNVVCTDLDLATFLYTLVERGAVIMMPNYKSSRGSSVKEGQMVTSKQNRHGKLTGLTANKDSFSFGIKIFDMNVITTDSVGDYRNFIITNFEGGFYSGWDKISFLPTAEENQFISESGIAAGNSIYFKNFTHPNRWISFFGHKYFITKAMIDRLTEECQFYHTCIKEMLAQGITYPESGEGAKTDWGTTSSKGETKAIKVDCFEVEIDVPIVGNYTKPDYNQKNLIMLTEKRKRYVYNLLPRLRFATRATEMAYVNMVKAQPTREPFPMWIQNADWEKEYRVMNPESGRKGNKKWDRFVLFQPAVGERGVAIRRRFYQKTEQVALDYEG